MRRELLQEFVYSDPENTPWPGTQFVTMGATFTHVAGTVNTSIGYLNDVVNSGANMSANGSVQNNGFGIAGTATCTANMNVIIRLTQMMGQRLQPDL